MLSLPQANSRVRAGGGEGRVTPGTSRQQLEGRRAGRYSECAGAGPPFLREAQGPGEQLLEACRGTFRLLQQLKCGGCASVHVRVCRGTVSFITDKLTEVTLDWEAPRCPDGAVQMVDTPPAHRCTAILCDGQAPGDKGPEGLAWRRRLSSPEPEGVRLGFLTEGGKSPALPSPLSAEQTQLPRATPVSSLSLRKWSREG